MELQVRLAWLAVMEGSLILTFPSAVSLGLGGVRFRLDRLAKGSTSFSLGFTVALEGVLGSAGGDTSGRLAALGLGGALLMVLAIGGLVVAVFSVLVLFLFSIGWFGCEG